MNRNSAFSFLLILVFIFFSLVFAKNSFAQQRLYQCSPAFDYATSAANCTKGPLVDCFDNKGNATLLQNGDTCTKNLAYYYSKAEGRTITARCINKCINPILTRICPRDNNNNCNDSACKEEAFCIDYSIIPTPTPCKGCVLSSSTQNTTLAPTPPGTCPDGTKGKKIYSCRDYPCPVNATNESSLTCSLSPGGLPRVCCSVAISPTPPIPLSSKAQTNAECEIFNSSQ